MPRKRSVNTLIVTLLTLVACAQPTPSTPPAATVPVTKPNETVPVTVPAAETASPLTLNLSAPNTTTGVGLYVVVPLKLQGSGAFSAAVTRLAFDPAQLELVGAQSAEGVLTSLDEPGSESRLLTVLSPAPATSQTVGLVFKLLGTSPVKVDVQALQLADEQNRLAELSSQASFSITPGEGGQAEPPTLIPFETQLLAVQQASGLSPQATTPPITVPTTLDATWANYSLGDLDQNNKVDLADLTLLSRFLLAKQVPTPYQAYASDLYDKVVAPATSQVVDTADLVTLAAKVGLTLLKKNLSFPSVHPLALSASGTQGGLVVAGNGGNGPLSVTAAADQPWIKVLRLPDSKDNVLLSVTADAPVGQSGVVTLSFAGGVKRTVKVTALSQAPNPNQIVGQFGATIQSAFSALTFTKTSASSPLELVSAAPVWDPASHVFTSSVTIKNTGTLDLPGVKAVIRNPNPTTLRPINPSGYASDDAPFIEFGPLGAGQSQTLPWRLYSPEDKTGTFAVDLTSVSGKLTLTTAGPASFSAAADTVVTVRGTDIRAETAFFIESTKLVVQKWSENSAEVVVPRGFPVATYGLMAANPSGDRAVLYPAFSVTAAPAPPVLDPKTHARSFVDGYVTDIVTKKPIAGATISLPGLSATTTFDGYFLLRGVPQGRQVVQIDAPGYEPIVRFAEVAGEQQTVTLKLAELQPKSDAISMIGTAGGIHYANNGSFLKVPAGALDQTVPIQFTQLTGANALSQLPQDGYFLAFARLGPVGLTFKKPATLYLPLQPGIVLPVGTPIRISYFDDRQAQWVQDITSGVITKIDGKLFLEYEINHFSMIGGQSFNPAPVSGRVVYPDGSPAVGAVTNFGVTDANGYYAGSASGSAQNYTATATAQSAGGSSGSAQAVGGGGAGLSGGGGGGGEPFKFPDIVLPDPKVINIQPPEFSQASCDTNLPQALSLRQVRSDEIPSGPKLIFRDLIRNFASDLLSDQKADIDLSSVQIKLNGVEFFSKLDLVTIENGFGIFSSASTLNLSSQSYDLSVSVKNKAGKKFERTTAIAVAESLSHPPIIYSESPADQRISVISSDSIVMINIDRTKPENSVSFDLPIQAVDALGNPSISGGYTRVALENKNSYSDVALMDSSFGSFYITLNSDNYDRFKDGLKLYLVDQSNIGAASIRTQNLCQVSYITPQVNILYNPKIGEVFLKLDKYVEGLSFRDKAEVIINLIPIPFAGDGVSIVLSIYDSLQGKRADKLALALSIFGLVVDATNASVVSVAASESLAILKSILKAVGQGPVRDAFDLASTGVIGAMKAGDAAKFRAALSDFLNQTSETAKFFTDYGSKATNQLNDIATGIRAGNGGPSDQKVISIATGAFKKALDAGLTEFGELAAKFGQQEIPGFQKMMGKVNDAGPKDTSALTGVLSQLKAADNLKSQGIKLVEFEKTTNIGNADGDVIGLVERVTSTTPSYLREGQIVVDQVKTSSSGVGLDKAQFQRLSDWIASNPSQNVGRIVVLNGSGSITRAQWDYVNGLGIKLVDGLGKEVPRP